MSGMWRPSDSNLGVCAPRTQTPRTEVRENFHRTQPSPMPIIALWNQDTRWHQTRQPRGR
jgi:hypothetical protein